MGEIESMSKSKKNVIDPESIMIHTELTQQDGLCYLTVHLKKISIGQTQVLMEHGKYVRKFG